MNIDKRAANDKENTDIGDYFVQRQYIFEKY